MILHGDCLTRLKDLADNSVDSVVTDPPYGISFMGRVWDYDVPSPEVWREVLRVLKPGAHLLSFGGTRTYHRMVVAIEDAGFEIKDMISWNYGSGFPKSLNVRKSGIKQGIFCACEIEYEPSEKERCPDRTNLQDLQSGVETQDTLSGGPKQDLLKAMQLITSEPKQDRQIPHAAADLPSMQETIQTKMAQSTQDMLLSMPGHSQILETGKHGSHETNCGQHEGSQAVRQEIRSGKSSLEGRRDLQAHQGQLHRSEVCPVSAEMDGDGSQGRVHNGTPTDHGDSHESVSDPDRGCSSQGPQHSQQSHLQSRIFPKQSGPQTCGRCGKPRIEEGLGTALKPANEPIVLARKPLDNCTIAENVLKYGTGGLNIDASRIATDDKMNGSRNPSANTGQIYGVDKGGTYEQNASGRFPANLILGCACESDIHDEGCAVAMLDAQSGMLQSRPNRNPRPKGKFAFVEQKQDNLHRQQYETDKGGASRFFYCAKSSKSERNAGLEGMPTKTAGAYEFRNRESGKGQFDGPVNTQKQNHHPTVKPIRLMEYLIRLITPPGGLVLDPFAGSGSTGVAAMKLGFEFIGIEMNAEYVAIAERRIEAAL